MSKRLKALVTGSKGFIGSAMVRFLSDQGYAVTGVDIVDGDDALDFFRESDEQFDLIVHAAYLVGGRVAIDGKNLNLAVNVQLDGALFNYALDTQSKRVLYFSSSAAYPTRLQVGDIPHRLRESDISTTDRFNANPDAHYGWAKLTGERMAKQASDLGLPVHVVRPFSGYGTEQSLDYPFSAIINRAFEGEPTVWGPPEQTRDWIHVDDILDQCKAIIDQDYREPVNLCTGKGTTMGQLLRIAWHEIHGKPLAAEDVKYLLDKPTGVIHRVGNPEKINRIYRSTVSLRKGVRRAIAEF
jgi:nucleoside-diphosphate-sugar epimerase